MDKPMNKFSSIKIVSFFLVGCSVWIACNNNDNTSADYNRWQKATGNSDGNKYSSLTEIDTNNVNQLQVAWEFHTGDMDTAAHSQIQCNPIIVDGIIYFTSPMLKVFAVD